MDKLIKTIKQNTPIYQFARFIIVGGMSVIIQYSIYFLLQKIGILYNIAYTIGYIISFIFNFIVSNLFTFKVEFSLKRGIKFGSAHLLNYFLQMILLNLIIGINVSSMIAPIFVFIISIPTNFIFVKLALKN